MILIFKKKGYKEQVFKNVDDFDQFIEILGDHMYEFQQKDAYINMLEQSQLESEDDCWQIDIDRIKSIKCDWVILNNDIFWGHWIGNTLESVVDDHNLEFLKKEFNYLYLEGDDGVGGWGFL